ncbi:Nitrogen specific two-component sensor histidine kinase NtrB [Granulibacter bethesdensis]|uniref:histidine kinase n=1 Tax=Granulibacter bethesdensis TaxID=364410 RepID=A0AAN0RDR1_9PROT|nr:ATP-binding protein [Granulibacter bethesdensis]AHJ63028.1 Nitrogen specific two-component sensor histidine kinase NtrB [Granulibacter bethesdensis]
MMAGIEQRNDKAVDNRLTARAASETGQDPVPMIDPASLPGILPMPLLILTNTNRIIYANHAAEQFLGLSVHQLLNLTLADVVAQDSPVFVLIDQVRRVGATFADHDMSLEGPRFQREGIAVQGTPLAEYPGCIMLTMQDSSAARHLDRQLAFRNAARSVTGMAAILAHEVKNPLSGIRGAAQLLESSVTEADKELTVLIREEADRIRALVDRMEAFGEKPIQRGAVNIHRVLEHVRRLAQTGFASGIRFVEHYDPSLPPVFGNRDQLIQVLLNLVKNASEAINDSGMSSGEIVLSTSYRHGVRMAMPGSTRKTHLPLIISVRDNGPGITEDMTHHLFDPFVTSKVTGSGLGLALVAKVIGDHGGLIEVDSRPGRTEFSLHMPMLVEESNYGD